MKKLLALALAFMLFASAAGAVDNGKEVGIKNYMFSEKELSVPVGTKVTWVNHDDVPHTIVETNKVFHSAALDTNDTFSYTFTKAGTYRYFCTLHPQMVAIVKVGEAK